MNIFDLTEKVAIVTGVAGYLGRYIVEALAEAGAQVLIADADFDRVNVVARGLMLNKLIVKAIEYDAASENTKVK